MKRFLIINLLLVSQLSYAAQEREVKINHAVIFTTSSILTATIGCALLHAINDRLNNCDDACDAHLISYDVIATTAAIGSILYAAKLGKAAWLLIDELNYENTEVEDHHQNMNHQLLYLVADKKLCDDKKAGN